MILTKSVKYRGKDVTFDELKNQSKIPLLVECDSCKKVFESTKYRITRNGHQLCQQCAIRVKESKDLPVGSVFGRLTVIGKSARPGYSVCRCSCEKKTVKEILNSSLIRGTTKSCGCIKSEIARKNAEEYLSRYQVGENHPNWKGGISNVRNRLEKTKAYEELRNNVFANSNYKCQKCGSSENLCLHHICNFQDYPELRLDENNCACLCEKCHREFHKRYGIKNTTTEQFSDFME